ncbi:MAG: DNA methyltransferase [Chloroflexota bacterium]
MSFQAQLISLLKTDRRFVDDDGELIPAAVMDAAWKTDHALVRLLLSEEDIKARFFSEIEGHWLFETNTFIEYISDKNFLDNSYTRFKNRIGLTIGGKFLRERGEVALVWPYKDCILEGGQTKEEERRKEIFFNEVLAQDEITRLLDPKVLTNFRRYTAHPVIASREAAKQSPSRGETASSLPLWGLLDAAEERHLLGSYNDNQVVEEKVTGFRRDENGVLRENLIIKGNNLIALHTLKTQFRGRVKLIYIDPPYNIAGDSFGYNDSFNHSTWLTFMKNRLEIARELMRVDGVIFIHIGDHEMHYLKLVADDVFGRDNFIATVPRKTRSGKSDVPYKLSQDFDWMLMYTKGASKNDALFQRTVTRKYYKTPDFPNDEWRLTDLTTQRTISERPNSNFTLVNPRNGQEFPVNPNRCWGITKDSVDEYLRKKKIVFPGDYDFLDMERPAMRVFKSEEIERKGEDFDKSYVSSDFLNQAMDELLKSMVNKKGTDEIVELFGRKVFAYPKNEMLLQRIIEYTTKEGDIVLDFHLGSGTTAAVAHKMGRQYIGIEQMDYIETIPVERLKKVIAGEQGGISKAVNWQGGGDFIYCELMKYNEAYMERIQSAQDREDLLDIWQDMAENSFLNWYVNPSMPEEAVSDFMAIGDLEKQKHLLAELFDKNQLYVNLSEMDDARFKVSEEEKELNRAFYGEG